MDFFKIPKVFFKNGISLMWFPSPPLHIYGLFQVQCQPQTNSPSQFAGGGTVDLGPVKNVVAFLCNIVVAAAITFPAAAPRNHDCDLEWKTRDKSGNSSGAWNLAGLEPIQAFNGRDIVRMRKCIVRLAGNTTKRVRHEFAYIHKRAGWRRAFFENEPLRLTPHASLEEIWNICIIVRVHKILRSCQEAQNKIPNINKKKPLQREIQIY